MNKKILYVIALIALVISACGGGGGTAPAGEEPSGQEGSGGTPSIVRIGWAGSPDTLNPGMAVLSESYTIFELVYDSMYELNMDGTFTLTLAESATVSDDRLVWTFKIRDGITFHDGQPLTAKDVVFSYNLYQSTEDYPWMGGYTSYFESVEATDANEVVITLTEAIPNIESQLVFLYVLPEHIWGSESAVEFDNVSMIGSGPFKMVEYAQSEFVHLAANKDHFLTPPNVDEAIFQTFENNDALVQAIKTGQVDMIMEMPATAVATLESEEAVEVFVGAPLSPTVTDIIFNQVLPENCPEGDGICTGHPALLDRNVRLALAHATDKQKIIDIIYLGNASPGLTLIPDGLGVWYNSSLADYEFDLAKAAQILDDNGYVDADGDGIRDMPDGSRSLTFRVNWPSDSVDGPRLAELLSEMWGALGIKTELQSMDPDALTAVCCPAFDFDVMLWGWGSDPDPNLLLSVMTSAEITTGSSETGYSNTEYDELYAQQAVEPDFEKRKALVWKMQEIVHEDVVYIIPYYDPNIQAYRSDRFTGWITGQPKLELSDPSSLTMIEPVK